MPEQSTHDIDKILAEIVEAPSIAAAARNLGVSKQAISGRFKRLPKDDPRRLQYEQLAEKGGKVSQGNLRPGRSPGRTRQYGEEKRKVEISLTLSSRDLLKSGASPFKAAGYRSLSEFVELVLRNKVKIPPKKD